MVMPYGIGHEITEIVYSFKESSTYWDSISAFVLTSLINSSFEKGLFPDELKITKVIGILKNCDKIGITNDYISS